MTTSTPASVDGIQAFYERIGRHRPDVTAYAVTIDPNGHPEGTFEVEDDTTHVVYREEQPLKQ